MGGSREICDPVAVNLDRTVVAAVAAICLAHLAVAAVPVISLDAPTPSSAVAPSGEDRPRITFAIPRYALTTAERDIVASCLVLEAASQGEFGMRGVMAVIRNRSRGLPELFAPTVLRPKQFSALNSLTERRESFSRVIARARHDPMWPTALAIVDAAVKDEWHDPTGGATHYTRLGERTRWTYTLARTTIIGRHAFYR